MWQGFINCGRERERETFLLSAANNRETKETGILQWVSGIWDELNFNESLISGPGQLFPTALAA